MVLSKKGMNTMRRTYLALSDEDRDYLITLSKKRTIQVQIVDRAKILLYKSDGMGQCADSRYNSAGFKK